MSVLSNHEKNEGEECDDEYDLENECEEVVLGFIKKYDRPQESSFRRGVRAMTESNYFGLFFVALILVNTVVMAWDHYPIEQVREMLML
jgi:hypothetical protein